MKLYSVKTYSKYNTDEQTPPTSQLGRCDAWQTSGPHESGNVTSQLTPILLPMMGIVLKGFQF